MHKIAGKVGLEAHQPHSLRPRPNELPIGSITVGLADPVVVLFVIYREEGCLGFVSHEDTCSVLTRPAPIS
jgi:hypothetical protein